jgi:hypothetical protein
MKEKHAASIIDNRSDYISSVPIDEILRIQIQVCLEAEENLLKADALKQEYRLKSDLLQQKLTPTHYELIQLQCSAYELSEYHAHLSESFRQLEEQIAQSKTLLESVANKYAMGKEFPSQIQGKINTLKSRIEDCGQMFVEIPKIQSDILNASYNNLYNSLQITSSLSSELSHSTRELSRMIRSPLHPPFPLPALESSSDICPSPKILELSDHLRFSVMKLYSSNYYITSPLHSALCNSLNFPSTGTYHWYHAFDYLLPYLFISHRSYLKTKGISDIQYTSLNGILSNLSQYTSNSNSATFPPIVDFLTTPQTIRTLLSNHYPRYVELIKFVQQHLIISNHLTTSMENHFKGLFQLLAYQSSYATFQALSMLTLNGLTPDQWRASIRSIQEIKRARRTQIN